MNAKNTGPAQGGMTLGEVYYMLFRQKWKILLISLAGVSAAATLYFVWPKTYESDADLLIKYVVDTRAPVPSGPSDTRVQTLDTRGEDVLVPEIAILKSFDLAREVATAIGPARVLAKAGGGTNTDAAAALIERNLTATLVSRASVIHLAFQHPDVTIVRPVLQEVIRVYKQLHEQIHQPLGTFDTFFTSQSDSLSQSLQNTEDSLRRAKAKAGVVSLDDAKKSLAEQISSLQQLILAAQVDLAQHQTQFEAMASMLPQQFAPTNLTRGATSQAMAVSQTNLTEYGTVVGMLNQWNQRKQSLLVQFTPQNNLVKEAQAQLDFYQQQKAQLETRYPGLLTIQAAGTSGDPGTSARFSLMQQQAQIAGLKAKIALLKRDLQAENNQVSVLSAAEPVITDLQRQRDMQAENLRYFTTRLEQSRFDEALGPGRISNISSIQEPCPPFPTTSKKLKAAAMVLAGSLALAFGLAFVSERVLDQSVRRPAEIEAKVGFPLLLSIPKLSLNGNGKVHRLGGRRSPELLAEEGRRQEDGRAEGPDASSHSAPAPTSSAHSASEVRPLGVPAPEAYAVLGPFTEALRDRIISLFEQKNLTHKPKLVAVTSCGEGAGVTTLAQGLACSMSETGEGNVLLVDMNERNGSAHWFHKGGLACGLDDALEGDKRGNAQVQDNLYVVAESASGDKLPRALPKRFQSLVPKLKASDYDYIIFDMPPVSQVSLTPRLARFMDMVLMVAEAEKTDRDVLKLACTLLGQSGANLGVVLNKKRDYLPAGLRQEL